MTSPAAEGIWVVATDASRLEELLKPYESVIERVQALLFWRNRIGMGVLVVLINLLFFIIYKLKLSFVPTTFLLLAIKVLLELQLEEGAFLRRQLPRLFPDVNAKEGGVSRIFALPEVSQFLAKTATCVEKGVRVLLPKERPTLVTGAMSLGVLLALFVFFRLTGTFWVNFVVVNLTLLLPAALLHPNVLPYVRKAIALIPS